MIGNEKQIKYANEILKKLTDVIVGIDMGLYQLFTQNRIDVSNIDIDKAIEQLNILKKFTQLEKAWCFITAYETILPYDTERNMYETYTVHELRNKNQVWNVESEELRSLIKIILKNNLHKDLVITENTGNCNCNCTEKDKTKWEIVKYLKNGDHIIYCTKCHKQWISKAKYCKYLKEASWINGKVVNDFYKESQICSFKTHKYCTCKSKENWSIIKHFSNSKYVVYCSKCNNRWYSSAAYCNNIDKENWIE